MRLPRIALLAVAMLALSAVACAASPVSLGIGTGWQTFSWVENLVTPADGFSFSSVDPVTVTVTYANNVGRAGHEAPVGLPVIGPRRGRPDLRKPLFVLGELR
jgi:hypothetical protein